MIQTKQLAAILDVLTQNPDGLSFDELRTELDEQFSDNALRYRLRLLRERGDVTTTGTTRNVRYHAVTPRSGAAEPEGEVQPATAKRSGILSAPSAKLVAQVRRPLEERTPVGYQPSLLTEYRPNETRLLSSANTKHLHELGATSQEGAAAGTYARDIFERLLIDLSWASSHLEGNTYSLLETRDLIERGQAAEGREARETQMVLNHKAAIEFLVEDVPGTTMRRPIVLNLHAILAENLLANPADAGTLRTRPVGISRSTYSPLANPHRIEEMFELILALARQTKDPFEESFFVFAHLAYLQPFMDVNKRTARLASNIPLIRENLRPLTFLEVPRDQYLEATLALYETADPSALRDVYLWAYERSCARYAVVSEELPEPDLFRQQHRDKIYAAVRAIVASVSSTPEEVADESASELFENAADRAKFATQVLADLHNLHEGNFMRYRISPDDFQRWVAARGE